MYTHCSNSLLYNESPKQWLKRTKIFIITHSSVIGWAQLGSSCWESFMKLCQNGGCGWCHLVAHIVRCLQMMLSMGRDVSWDWWWKRLHMWLLHVVFPLPHGMVTRLKKKKKVTTVSSFMNQLWQSYSHNFILLL